MLVPSVIWLVLCFPRSPAGLADMPGSETVITVLESLRACYEAL